MFAAPIVFLIAFISPLFWLIISAALGESVYFAELVSNELLNEYLIGSLSIGLSVSVISAVFGAFSAWIVVMHQFPCKKLFEILLFMPIAIPAYINSMLYANALESAGIVQTIIREYFHLEYGEYYFPNIRSTGGVILILSLSLYPYIYMMMRAYLKRQSSSLYESAALLGCSQKALFWRIGLQASRPALIAGMAMVMMEALTDFGVSSLYGVLTLNTGIYRAWQLRMDGVAAARLAVILSCFTLSLMLLEKKQRKLADFSNNFINNKPINKLTTSLRQKIFYSAFCFILSSFGFVLPLVMLLDLSFTADSSLWVNEQNLASLGHSLKIAIMVAIITAIFGLIYAYIQKTQTKSPKLLNGLLWLGNLGYSLSGNIIAVSVLLIVITLQNYLSPEYSLISNSIIGLLWGCSLRFFTISYQNMHASFANISSEMQHSAAMLGLNRFQILRRVHLPLIKGTFGVALLLVFVDTLKELPATIMLRPFNMTPLSVRIYELAKDDMIAASAPLALILIALSGFAVLLLNKYLFNDKILRSED